MREKSLEFSQQDEERKGEATQPASCTLQQVGDELPVINRSGVRLPFHCLALCHAFRDCLFTK